MNELINKIYKYVIIVRYSEIGLKGNNKGDFEKRLVNNIRESLKQQKINDFKVERKFSRIIIESNVININLTKVFGIYSYSFAKKAEELSMDGIKNTVEFFLNDFNDKTTFRVSAKRLQKQFPINSMQIEKEIGAFIVEKTNALVKLTNFNKELGIELVDNSCYVYDKKIRGPGGLPVGVEGKVFVLIDDKNLKNSINAAILIMKRGCEIFPISFSDVNLDELADYSPQKLNIIIIKMLDDINNLKEKYGVKALVVGETLSDFTEINTNLLVLRPMILNY